LGEEVWAAQEHPIVGVERILGHLLKAHPAAEAGVVHQGVDPIGVPLARQHAGERIREVGEGVGAADVKRKCGGRAAVLPDLLDGPRGAFRADVVRDDDAHSACGDLEGGTAPDAGTCSGHDDDLLLSCMFAHASRQPSAPSEQVGQSTRLLA
jgi:hypothetical protein